MASEKKKSTKSPVWTSVGFVDEFKQIHDKQRDCSFAFILGAGASITSGIPGAAKLASDWVKEIRIRKIGERSDMPVEKWATAENLGIPNFAWDRVASFYPEVYDLRFSDKPDFGYACLEDAMKDAEPNVGYSILAKLLENTRHKVVITTNFDNLVADALSIYSDTFPLVCGHESLTGFVQPQLRRPLVAKIHRDLLLAPMSDEENTSHLSGNWANVLKKLLSVYTPVVIGYGGNDGSLMGFLDSLDDGFIRGGIYWCYRREDGLPEKRICELVARQKGKLVEIIGFDELMLQLGTRFDYRALDKVIQEQADKRVDNYRKNYEKYLKSLSEPVRDAETEKAMEPVRAAMADMVKEPETWWTWELKAQAEKDPKKQEAIYREGLKHFPDSAELTGNFAVFMNKVRKNYDESERLFKRAIELDPDDADYLGNFALFLHEVRKDYDAAEQLYKRVLELDPENVSHIGNFAKFLYEVRKDYDEVERLLRRALEIDPDQANNTGNLATYMWEVREDYDEAERLYKRALELDPDDANHTGNFANFMCNVRKDYNEAERLYVKALELDPNRTTNVGNFANFMRDVRKDYNEAERLYRRSLELNPENEYHKKNFEIFMKEIRKDGGSKSKSTSSKKRRKKS